MTIANKGVTDAATAQTTATTAQDNVDALKTVVGADDTVGLRKRIKTNETAISTLQGTDTSKSACAIAAEEVAKIVDGAPESFDTLKELSDWISTHGNDATAMNSAITNLQAIVAGIGGESEKATVVAYVTDAIAALKIGDYAKAADLTALAARVKTLEDSPAAGITAEKIAAWDAKQDAGNYVDQSAYNAKITALETADDNNTKAIAAVKTTADAAVPKNEATKAGTGIKVTVDANGLVTGMAGLAKTDIPTIDQDQVDGLATALAGKQDTVTFNTAYDASTNKAATMADIGTAKNNLVGTAEDVSSVDTIKGAKKYADEKASAALGEAKTYADSIVTGTGGVTARVDTLETKVDTLETKVDVEKVSTAIATAKNEAIADAETKNTTLKTAILGEGYTGTVKDAADTAATAQNGINTLNGKVGTVPDGKTIVGMITEATYNDTEVRNLISTNKTAIDTLIGNVEGDNTKSVRTMAQEEVAKIVDDAPESFDTLKEIAAWISDHDADVVTMNNSIKANTEAITKLNGDAETAGSVAKSINDAISPVSTRITTLENKVTNEKIAAWDKGQANIIETIKVGGAALEVTDKAVDITSVSTDLLTAGTNTLIFNCGDASAL